MKHLGNSPDGAPRDYQYMNMDLTKPMEMVSAFALARFRLTELEQSVDTFKHALENKGV